MAIKVYIDQGHNPKSHNTGAEGNGFQEADITYDIGTRLALLLRENSAFSVKRSRRAEDTVLGVSNADSLRVRVNEANAWGANLFLSLHTNAAENTSATGSEALVYGPTSKAAVAVAGQILTALHNATGLRNRGILYRPELYVLKRTRMPAVLVEVGFISNPYDAALMTEQPGRFAEGIYRGLLNYYGLS